MGETMKENVITQFVKENPGISFFYLKTVLGFGLVYVLYELYILETEIFWRYLEYCSTLTTQVLTLVFGEEGHRIFNNPQGYRTDIRAFDGAYVVVTQGCDASVVFAVIISTIAAWPSPVLKKMLSIILGLVIMFGLNIFRITLMFIADIHWPLQFELMHEWVLPSLLVLAALGYFFVWTKIMGTHPADAN